MSGHLEGKVVSAGSYAGGCRCDGCTDAHRTAAIDYRRRHPRPEITDEQRMEKLSARFWSKVDKNGVGGCWLWIAARNAAGYGTFGKDGRGQLAHRVAYELLVGPIPDGLTIDHRCRVPACVNPAHLEPVTLHENLSRAGSDKRRRARERGECANGHPWTPASIRESPLTGTWMCRVCSAERDLRRAAS